MKRQILEAGVLDPFSQGILGASLAQMPARKSESSKAFMAGMLGGMLADLDVLIRSSNDSLLAIEYHRHFTHSLLFVPIGGLIAALILWPLYRKKIQFKRLYIFAFLGYLTHGVLDGCTSYGTHLLWPFSQVRTSWSVIAIVDPFFTMPMTILLILRFTRLEKYWRFLPISYFALYMSFGSFMHWRAESAHVSYAKEKRYHRIKESNVKPSVGGLLVWRGIYTQGHHHYVDGIRLNFFGGYRIYPGRHVEALSLKQIRDLPPESTLYKDIARFSFFSENLIYWQIPGKLIGDLRYSLLPQSTDPLWGIEIDLLKPDVHAQFINMRNASKEKIEEFKKIYLGVD